MPSKLGVVITSPSLFEVARDAVLIQSESGKQNEALGLTAVVFSAAALEALVNEVTELADLEVQLGDKDPVLQAFAEAMVEAERSRGSIHLKFIVASLVLSGRAYQRGSQPFQDFMLLISLRNAVMHLRPTTIVVVEGKDQWELGAEDIYKKLQARGLIEPVPRGAIGRLLDKVAQPQVAKWALNCAASMAQSFLSLFPDPFRSDVLVDQAAVFRQIDTDGSTLSTRPN